MCDTYNGWCNRETWAAALHLSNDEALYRATLEILDGFDTEPARATVLGSWVERSWARQLFPAPGDDEDPLGLLWRSMIADVGSLWRVDWNEVLTSFQEDLS
jgi:hypothetical protein